MAAKFRHEYKGFISSSGGVIGEFRGESGFKGLFALPAEYGGVAGYVKPEELFALSCLTCSTTTLMYFLKKFKVIDDISGIEGGVVAAIEPGNGVCFTEVNMSFKIFVKKQEAVESVNKAVENAEKYCPVLKAIKDKVKVRVQANVEVKPS